MSCRRVGSMDCPVWWDEETVAVVMYHMECTLATRSRYRYTVKLYFYKIRKIAYMKIFTCIIKIMYCIHSS
jgi:hypothetical protein